MTSFRQFMALGSAACLLCLGTARLAAQDPNGGGPGGGGPGGFGGGGPGGFGGGGPGGFGGGGPGGGFGGGNFDPAQMQDMMQQMQQMQADQQKQQLEVTSDDEWKVLQAAIQKVTDARAQLNTGMGGGMGMFGGGRGGRGGRGGGAGGFGGGGPGGPGGMGNMPGMPTVQPNPTLDALQKAVDDKASNDDIKAAIAKFLDDRKQKQANLDKAIAELRKLLSVRQEAIAYTMGLI